MFFATASGEIKEFSPDFLLVQSFQAYEPDWSISHLKYLDGTSLLLSIGIKQGHSPTVHLWDLKNKSGKPYLHATVKVTNNSNLYPLTTFAISSNHSILAFGFADGTVILSRGDIVHDRGSVQRIVYSGNSPITGLEFTESPDSTIMLFCTSINQVFTLPTNGKNGGKPERILDKNRGAALGCVTKQDDKPDGQLIVARDDEVQFYTRTRRGNSFVFDIPKKFIYSYKQYLIFTTSSDSASSNGGSLVYADVTRLLIVDTVNRFIAFNGQIALGLKHIFDQWGCLCALGADGILYKLQEKPLKARLDILMSRNLYDMALQLINFLHADDEDTQLSQKIQRSYGDHLYNEGDYEGAMEHYISALNVGQTSQVILKYRDSTHISLLTKYLEALYDTNRATKEHTTLLMNCYAKLKDLDKMTKFIERAVQKDGSNSLFDFETAIEICRNAGYSSLASYLAAEANDTDLVVNIKLQDLKDYKGCLSYIKSLDVNDALRVLILHSRLLLDQFPMETTLVLIQLFTGKFIPEKESTGLDNSDKETQDTRSTLTTPVVQSYRAFVNYMTLSGLRETSSTSTAEENGADVEIESGPTYQPPRPRLIFASFVNHPNEFVIFLEACIEFYDDQGVNPKDMADLVSTLFEMYLNLARQFSESSEKRKEWQQKAKKLTDTYQGLVHEDTIFLLSHLLSFHEGELLAREKDAGFEVDLFRSCMAAGDVDGALEVLNKYGNNSSGSELYPLALTFFSSTEERLNRVGQVEFAQILNHIKKQRLMSPLQVVQALSINSVVSIGHIRPYLLEVIQSERNEIERNSKLTELYQAETKAKKDEIKKMIHDPQAIQYVTCSSCGTPLDLPAVHFACSHSYHQRCLNTVDGSNIPGLSEEMSREAPQCPTCLPEVDNINAVRQAQQVLSEQNELFQATLDDSEGKFRVVTDFIGRGALSSI